MIGQLLGDRYEIQQQLGKNAGRRTLLARDVETQELVVIKLLSFGTDFEWDDLKLFEREAETLKALSHPSIPRYLDFFEIDLPNTKGFALVQTYVEGKSLEQHLKAGRTFSQAEVKQLAKALLEILIYLHKRQPPVIHRDIKPSNVLLTNRSGNSVGEVYLVDFGSVQTIPSREGVTYTVVGTYGYIPLEQFGGRTVPASDLYGLGATLIYLVTGTHPADLPQQDGRIQFEHSANLNSAFSSWLRWMIEPSLEKRLTSAAAALQALEDERQRDIDFPSIRKPIGSKVWLTKDADYLEIVIPPKGFSTELIASIVYAILLTSFFIPFTLPFLSLAFSIAHYFIFILFIIPFWSYYFIIIKIVLFALFRRRRIHIDRHKICLNYEVFNFKYTYCSAPREYISKLQLIYSDVGDAKSIAIWVGKQEHQLDCLTAPELDWLIDELKDWLKLPIEVRRLPPVEA
jgi:serine/threonine protein kinase